MMVRVEIDNLFKRFSDGTSIGPISLTIQDGEMLSLLGPSGSGKTTTLRMVAGFIVPDGGSLRFDGKDVIKQPPRERKIGMVVQSVALFPNMSVYQNIAFALDVAGWEHHRAVKRVEDLADIVGVRNLLHRKVNEISGGEGQRIALARALALEPALLLLDEPFSALDPKLRQRLQEELRDLQQKLGITTIYVTHSQSEAYAISDKIAILNEGAIIQAGPPQELYENPRNDFVATFIGGGSILKGIVRKSHRGFLDVQVGDLFVETSGDVSQGTEVSLSVKPEDVSIIPKTVDSLYATIVSITQQVGHYRIILEIQGQTIQTTVPTNHSIDGLERGKIVGLKIDSQSVDVIEER
ncbi:MAG: ABC transporter ATP-binding protein [Candidatus Thorarchaeota archaeon]|nr:ABC transporter ATP-binding protein [Candidatus Thorarchaeota archaeon]